MNHAITAMLARKQPNVIVRSVTTENWLELKHEGRTYLVSVQSLLDAYIIRPMEKV